MRILIAEDEPELNDVIRKKLTAEKYAVDACHDGQEALDYLASAQYDLLVLDIMMPRLDGLQVLARYRAEGGTAPVLFLTAKDSVQDRVAGLDGGADDYLVKPFAFDELLARMRVLLRRGHGSDTPIKTNLLQIADLTVDTSSRTVARGERKIALSSKEFSILEYMMRNQDIVLDRNRIIEHVWNFDYDGESNVVDVYIRYLRRKIDDGFDLKLIHTIRGAGYVIRTEAQ